VAVNNARLFTATRQAEETIRRRASEMQTVAEVGAEAAQSLELEQLLQNVVNLTKDRFALYHAHMYLLDADDQHLALAAGAGEVGRQMVMAGHGILLNSERSLVARAARERTTVVINNVQDSPDFLPNPLLASTQSEMAVPMIVGDQVIGVLDVQASEVDRFTNEDVLVMSTLASQVAVAITNAQLYSEQVKVMEQLREVDRLKSEFLASMSHELRTPLNSIIGYAEVLLDGIDGELTEDMDEDVSAIHGSGKHLLNLINDILDLAKIEAGQMDLITEDVELETFIQDVINASRVLLMDKPVDLNLEIAEGLSSVHADSLRLRQIVSNLTTNAIKFTDEGSITIRADHYESDPRMVKISVIDTGSGISAENLPLIFERFRQVDQSHTRRVGGTGLGLSITRQLVWMHGGEIWVDSELGTGSTFNFTIPIMSEYYVQR
ncbi:MAG: GAF domain-containing sensor histidine kinase, partial [Anaerolineae bacterium]|nr:GAF domain-containing sensor histidine kinase [Anaerolineae bacterium]